MDGSPRRPPNEDNPYPEVVEDPAYTAAWQALAGDDASRLEWQLRAVGWAISQNPWQFPLVPNTRLRRVRTVQWPHAPRLLIFFTIDGDGVRTLRSIEAEGDEET